MVEDKRASASTAAIGIGILAILIFSCGSRTSRPSTSPSTATYSVTNAGPISFAVFDPSVSYGISSYDTQAVQQADLSMLISTGAQCIRVDLGYAPWLSNDQATTGLIDSVMSSIRTTGRCLIIADAASESYRNGGAIPWTQFEQAWVSRVSTLAARYRPDYYIVIKEPGWYVPLVSDSRTNPAFQNVSDWVALTQSLASAVLTASPSTRIGVSIAGDSLKNNNAYYTAFLNQLQSLSGLSFIGFDLYTSSGQTATQTYLSQNAMSKDIWIAEAWSSDGPQIYNPANAESDARWMASIYRFGQSIGAKMLIPFYTDLFSGYSIPRESSSLVTFYQGRTPVFTEFKNVVAGNP
jgi:hypothetical protein